MKEIKEYDQNKLDQMKADPRNYFDSLGKAKAAAADEISSSPGMICPDV